MCMTVNEIMELIEKLEKELEELSNIEDEKKLGESLYSLGLRIQKLKEVCNAQSQTES